LSRFEELHDLTRMRVSVHSRLLEHRRSIDDHFESSAPRRHQLDCRIREPTANLGRQTGGPRFV